MSILKADTSWMQNSFGISVHWTAAIISADGNTLPFPQAVKRFDVERFADTLAAMGATHCIFTLTHAKEFLALPCAALDKILPGRTTERDLIGEIISALKKRSIRFIAYYNHSCNGDDDPEWKKACGYADGINGNLDRFADNICSIVGEIALRYKEGISGWWFDSSYSIDPRGPHNTISCDMGSWLFPWEKLNTAAKSGNPNAAVTCNSGVGRNFLYFDSQDYCAGETVDLNADFEDVPHPGMQDHRWVCCDSPNWILDGKVLKDFPECQFNAIELAPFIIRHLAENRMVTLNAIIDQRGIINPHAVKLVRDILK